MSIDQKKILVFSDWYLPGYKAGGPIRSLANLVNNLQHDFYIVTRNTDHHSTEPYEGIEPNTWIHLSSNVHVIYLDAQNQNTRTYASLIREINADRIYFNSLFSPLFTLQPLRVAKRMKLSSKCVLAPRGMLKSGALTVKSNKKKIFLAYARLTGLYNNIIWHATNEQEADEIRRHFPGKRDIRVSPNLIAAPGPEPIKKIKSPGQLRLVCIARISPEKGILEAVRFLSSAGFKTHVSCDFYGTQQNADYLRQCQDEASRAENCVIQFPGEISPDQIPDKLADADFFLLTTWGENFGHAIAEALIHATPVIISDRTPWKHLSDHYAGWDLPLEKEPFAHVLNQCLGMNNEEYLKWSHGAFEFGKTHANDPASIAAAYAVFA